MNYSEIIVSIIESYFKINKKEIRKAIKENKEVKNGDYSILSYLLRDYIAGNPLIIAQKIKDILKHKDFKKVEVVGPYVNIFLKKTSFKKKNKKIIIAYCIKEDNDKFNLQDTYNLIVSEFISKVYLENGYSIEKYYFNRNRDDKYYSKYIIEKLQEKQLITKWLENEFIDLKNYNLPPLLINYYNNHKYEVSLDSIVNILKREEEDNINSIKIIINKYESIRYKQIIAVANLIDERNYNKVTTVSLGIVKLNENLKKYEKLQAKSENCFLKKAKDDVIKSMRINKIIVDDTEAEKIISEIIIFSFLNQNLGYDVILDYDKMFSYNKKSYLYIKVIQKQLNKEIKSIQDSVTERKYKDIDLSYEKELINIKEEYNSVIRRTMEKCEIGIIIEYLYKKIREIDEIYLKDNSKMSEDEHFIKLRILEENRDIIDKILKLLGTNSNILIKVIQKLTVY